MFKFNKDISHRNLYYLFIFFNILSVSIISQELITLITIKLQAGPGLIGLINSFRYLTFMFVPLGRIVLRKEAPVHHMALYWRIRYLLLTGMPIAIIIASKNSSTLALIIFTFSIFGFYIAKGFGFAANTPVIGHISEGEDRGAFLSKSHMITIGVQVITSFCIAFYLSMSDEIIQIVPLISISIISGLIGSIFLSRVKEPNISHRVSTSKTFYEAFKNIRKTRFYRFLIYRGISATLSSMMIPFTILFLKEELNLGDNHILYLIAFGGVIGIIILFIQKNLLDKIGAKIFLLIASMFYIIASSLLLISSLKNIFPSHFILAITVLPLIRTSKDIILIDSKTYLLRTVKIENRLDFGILYQIVRGIFGVTGAIFAGIFIKIFSQNSFSDVQYNFQAFWILCLFISVLLFIINFTIKKD